MIKKITILYLLISLVIGSENLALSDNQILSYEIPPSVYLERLAEISEKKAPRLPDPLALLSIGTGLAMYLVSASSVNPSTGFNIAAFLSGSLFVGLGINRIVKKSSLGNPISDEMKMFVEIKNEPDVEKREVMSYNSLVFFSSHPKTNRKKQSNSGNPSLRGASFKDMLTFLLLKSVVEESVKSEEIFNSSTLHQRALDGFLNQIPINIVFD